MDFTPKFLKSVFPIRYFAFSGNMAQILIFDISGELARRVGGGCLVSE
jgi:hypothetical protein